MPQAFLIFHKFDCFFASNPITRRSPSCTGKSKFICLSKILGPCAFISVSSLVFNFIFIRLFSSIFIKSLSHFKVFNMFIISLPTNPPQKPKHFVSSPKFFKTIETLIPFPPMYISSFVLLLVLPREKLSTFNI